MMRSVRFSSFFNSGKVNYTQILVLIVLTVVLATLGKLIVYPMNGKIITDWVWFMQSYSMSGILGAIVFIFATLKIFSAKLSKYKLI